MHSFYYDETEHSRKITYKTVNASEFYDGFLSVIVGWDRDIFDIEQKMSKFKEKHQQRQSKGGEIKSRTLSNNELKYGFATLKSDNIELIQDFLSVFDKNTCLYIFSASKIEYIVRQLLSYYQFSSYNNVEAAIYTISKAIVLYHPAEVLEQIEGDPEQLIIEIINFLKRQIAQNHTNPTLKHHEIKAFGDVVTILQKHQTYVSAKINWNYTPAFDGFVKYLEEKQIREYSLIIDEEHNTFLAAKTMNLQNVSEGNSTKHIGIQVADMLAGIIGKLMKAIHSNLRYIDSSDGINQKLLDKKWFVLTEEQFRLYKQLHNIICKWDQAWYKTYSGMHADDFVTLIALLDYLDQFNSAEEMCANDIPHSEYFNILVCERLKNHYTR